MTRLPIKPGIDGLPTSSIPTDPADFVDWFKNSFIPRWAANADIRNAIPGTGVQISGTSDTPGFVGFEAIAGTSVLGNPSGATGDVQAITAGADGEALQRIGGALVFAPVSVVSADSIQGDGSAASPLELVHDAVAPGNSRYYGTDVSGAKGFFALPAGGATITTLTQAGGTSQTYPVPASAKIVLAIVIGGGGGGGSGGEFASSSGGGGGGGGGGIGITMLSTALLGATVAVTFTSTTGGAGGTQISTPTTGGIAGTVGATANFGGFLKSTGGAGGSGGTIGGAGAGGGGGTGIYGTGLAGGASALGGASPGTAQSSTAFAPGSYAPTGGGGGESINGGTFFGGAAAGGGGGSLMTLAGGIAGTSGGLAVPGGTGGAGANSNAYAPASGGGGGGAGGVIGAAGGPGGSFGGGGGGGGSCLNTGTHSGAGGNGGPAAVVVIAW